MVERILRLLPIINLLLTGTLVYAVPFKFDVVSSSVKVSNSGTLTVNNPISTFDGTLIRMLNGTISGDTVTFERGIFEDADNQLLMKSIFNPLGTLMLSGDDFLCAQPSTVLQEVRVSGVNNKISGQPIFTSNIVLADSNTTLTLAVQSAVNKSIDLNSGTLFLGDDLRFTDEQKINGPGVVDLNGYQLGFGGKDFSSSDNIELRNATDIELHSNLDFSGSFTFSSDTAFNGNGYILNLADGGLITVADGVTVCFTDIVIKGLGDSAGKIIYASDSSSIKLSNVTVELVDDVTQSQGGILVNGPTTWVVKNFDWTFDSSASLTVDGVTLWKDSAGENNIGEISFGIPTSIFFTSISSGTIKCVGQADVVVDQSELISRIEVVETCCDELRTSTGELISIIDECCSSLKTSTGQLQSQIDAIDDLVQSCCDALATSTGELQSQIDELDDRHTSEREILESRIEIVETCCDELRTSTGELISIIDECCSSLKTSTGQLQSQIDVIDDFAQSCCDALATSTGELQSQIDELDDRHTSEREILESRIEIVETCCDELRTSTGELISIIDECCSSLKTSTGQLQSQIDVIDDFAQSCCDELATSTGELQSCCDFLASLVDPLIILIQSDTGALASMIDMLKTSTGELQSQIDMLVDEGANCQSQIDALKTSTGELQSQIDLFDDALISRVEVVESKIEILETCCDELRTSTGELQSELDECCSELKTSTGELQSQIDLFDDALISRVETVESKVEILETCCDELRTSTGELVSQIDDLCSQLGCECTILVTGTLEFTLDMLPGINEAVVFKFDPCFAPCKDKPRLVFDPAVYGNDGRVVLPSGSRMVFTGEGIVELLDGVEFNMEGTPYCLDPNPPANPQADWPCLITENCAVMHLDMKATVSIGGGASNDVNGSGGAGCVITRKGGTILLDQESHLVFGNTYADDMLVSTEFASAIITNDPKALITFEKACFDVIFNHQAALSVLQGNVEFNMYRGARSDQEGNEAAGVLKSLQFEEGSLLYVLRRGTNVAQVRFAPNFNTDPNFALGSDIATDFNNRCGEVCGGGHVQFKEFAGIATTLGEKFFCQGATIAAGSIIPTTITYNEQTLFDLLELTADTLIPAGSVLAAGSVVDGIPLVSPLTVATDTVFNRATQLAAGTTIAPFQIVGSTIPLASALLLPPASRLPVGSTISPESERVNTTTDLQENFFETIAPLVTIFSEMSFIASNATTPDGRILVRLGSLDPASDGVLGALCPPVRDGVRRDGSVVRLQSGDHDVQYNAGIGSLILNEIQGFTFNGEQFVIINCDEATRTET